MRLSPITGLFGANSSGKTGILQLLLMVKQTVESADRAAVLEFGDDRSLTNLGSFHDAIHNHDESRKLWFSMEWDRSSALTIRDPLDQGKVLLSGKDFAFECAIVRDPKKDRLRVTELTHGFSGGSFTMQRNEDTSDYELAWGAGEFQFIRAVGRPARLPGPVKFYGFPDQVYASYQNAGFLADLQLAFESFFSDVCYLGPLRDFPQRHYTWKGSEPADMGRRGERVVDALLASRHRGSYISRGRGRRRQSLEERVAHWLKELGLIHDFSVDPIAKGSNLYQVHVQRSPSSAKVLITDVGFGVSQVLPVITICYYAPEGSTILLEQPEIHLHPSVQSGLADVIIDAVRTRRVQVIVESHSEHLLRRFQRRIAEQALDPTQTAFYFCSTTEEASELIPLETDLFGNILNWPENFFGDEYGEMAAMTRAAMNRQIGAGG